MLLEKVLNQTPDSAALLLRPGIYPDDAQAMLMRDVLGMANADAGDSRYLLFGAEQNAGGLHICGLDEDAMTRFRELSHDISQTIEPRVRIAQVFAEIEGKAIAGLEISECNNPPYTLRHRIDENMRTGACWVRENEDIRPARRDDLDRIYARRAADPPLPVLIGLNDDPGCVKLVLDIPDTSRPPSQRARAKLMSAINAKKAAAKVMGDENTGMGRLAHARIFGPDAPYLARGMDTLMESYQSSDQEYRDADLHYFFEQQAVRVNVSLRNQQSTPLDNAVIEISLPQVPGFEIADRLYSDPEGQQSAIESSLAGYPDILKTADSATVRVFIGRLDPNTSTELFETPLRFRVGPQMRSMKVAVRYKLVANGLVAPLEGRLKLVFRG